MSEKIMSIIMLNWNRLHYSKKTLGCIIERTTIPHELILVDNGSTDGTREYLKSMANKTNAQKVTYVFNDKNLGVAGGRNSGLVHAKGEYLVTIDDDVIVPHKWDILMKSACDKVPGLGITGVNVEPIRFPVRVINGVRIRLKKGNLGGACLCLPRRVFKRVGYYKVFGQYGLEDSDMFVRLQTLGLLSAYIEPKGKHLDTDKDKVYRKVKNRVHKKRSQQLMAFAREKIEYKRGKSVYEPYILYDPDDEKWSRFERFDGTIEATADVRDTLNEYDETKGMKMGNKLEIKVNESGEYEIDTGIEKRFVSKDTAICLIGDFDKNKIKYVSVGIK